MLIRILCFQGTEMILAHLNKTELSKNVLGGEVEGVKYTI